MKSYFVFFCFFLFFCSLIAANKHDTENIENFFQKNFPIQQNGSLSIKGSNFNPYEEQLVQQWVNESWISSHNIKIET